MAEKFRLLSHSPHKIILITLQPWVKQSILRLDREKIRKEKRIN